jgi:purine-binding chemotaxis protein CheW
MPTETVLDLTQYLTFQVGGEEFGVEILRSKEILPFEKVTRLPGMPTSLRGVINLRGNVVPVIDLSLVFGMPETAITKLTCIIIVSVMVEGKKMPLGLITEAVNQVVDIDAEDLQEPPTIGTRVKAEYLKKLGRSSSGFVLILDIDKILTEGEYKDLASFSKTADTQTITAQ